jgi:hypothetical protein
MPVQRKKLQVRDRVEVQWIDAEGDDEWRSVESVSEFTVPPIIRTVGFLTTMNDGFVCVSQNLDEVNDNVSHTMLIPRGMILDIIPI